MTKLRFQQDLDGNLTATIQVHTNKGLRRAHVATPCTGDDGSPHAVDFATAVEKLMVQVSAVKAGASKSGAA